MYRKRNKVIKRQSNSVIEIHTETVERTIFVSPCKKEMSLSWCARFDLDRYFTMLDLWRCQTVSLFSLTFSWKLAWTRFYNWVSENKNGVTKLEYTRVQKCFRKNATWISIRVTFLRTNLQCCTIYMANSIFGLLSCSLKISCCVLAELFFLMHSCLFDRFDLRIKKDSACENIKFVTLSQIVHKRILAVIMST